MDRDQVRALFDQQAASYDAQWARLAPINDCLRLLLRAMFAELPHDARILCVGVGTGDELVYLGSAYPGWQFTVVEPSEGMLTICRQRTQEAGMTSRCVFHAGYLGTLPEGGLHDAATSFLVSQFILEEGERMAFFKAIASQLKPGGLLASSDLAADVTSPEYDALLPAWMGMMSAAKVSPDMLERVRTVYARDVAVLPPAKIESFLRAAGFAQAVPFFQAGLIHAWMSHRAAS